MRYGSGPEVLRDLSFGIPQGGFCFITGPSGAGKSSILRLLYMAHRPSRGRIRLFGQDVAALKRPELARLRRRIGVVFQDFRLIEHLSVIDNVALPLRIAGAQDDEIRDHVGELLRWVGLGDRLTARPNSLSGGEQQRVAIARAVINRPDLLMADEPTGNVDDHIAWRLVHLFVELHKLGTTVIIATHNQSIIRRLDYPVLHLTDGALHPETGIAAPANRFA